LLLLLLLLRRLAPLSGLGYRLISWLSQIFASLLPVV
jgi:hypothetical protein